MIDPHVHLRDFNQKEKESVTHGLSTFKKAGFTHVFDMPNTNPPILNRDVLLDRLSLYSQSKNKVKNIQYHVYIGLTKNKEQIKEAVSLYNEFFPLVIGLKLFLGQSTGDMGIVNFEDQREVVKELVNLGYTGTLVVHAEKEALIDKSKYIKGKYETNSDSRRKEAEIESIKDIINIVKETKFQGNLHIAHISTKEGVLLVKENKKEISITMGATAHHALLSREDAIIHSRYLKMNPPLRDKSDSSFIYSSLLNGNIDWIESDHAPHTLKDKENDASGIVGVTGTLYLIKKLQKDNIDEEILKNLLGRNVIKTFKLDEEEIKIPKDIDKRLKSLEGEYEVDSFSFLKEKENLI